MCGLILVSFLRLFVWARLKKVVRFDVCFFVYVRFDRVCVFVCVCEGVFVCVFGCGFVCVVFLIKRGKYKRK